MSSAIRELAKRLVFSYTRFGAPRYPYNIEPMQLAAIVNELERTSGLNGAIVEIGVARGMTTRFICEHLVRTGRVSERLYAIDTFNSFNEDDVRFETTVRGKRREELVAFDYNDFGKWRKNFAQFPFVTPVMSDCATFDYSRIGPIKLAFLDVDLYRPTKAALGRIYAELCDGGVILVDDVKNGINWDGAHQAYVEFCAEQGLPTDFIGTKCGVLRKEPSARRAAIGDEPARRRA